jgi:cation transport ATPase
VGSTGRWPLHQVQADKPASETILSKIMMSVEEAQAKKTSYQTFSDAFAKYYTPAWFGGDG